LTRESRVNALSPLLSSCYERPNPYSCPDLPLISSQAFSSFSFLRPSSTFIQFLFWATFISVAVPATSNPQYKSQYLPADHDGFEIDSSTLAPSSPSANSRSSLHHRARFQSDDDCLELKTNQIIQSTKRSHISKAG
jgi:hypothetical protein